MEAKIIHEFKGIINKIEIRDERNYHSIRYILEKIEVKFGKCYTQEFIEDLNSSLEMAYLKYEYFDYAIFEESIDIENIDKFEDIVFNYEGLTYRFKNLNDNLKNGKYNK